MKLFKYALFLLALLFCFISVCGATYTYEGYPHNNIFANCGECFTLKVTTTATDGEYMTFYWAKANKKIIIDNTEDYIEVTMEGGNRVYYSTQVCIPGYESDPAGEWFVEVVEYKLVDGEYVEIGADKNNFHVECDSGSEFALGSFVVLLSAGGLYLTMRRKGRFF